MTDAEILAVIAEVAAEQASYHGPVEPGMLLVEDLRLDSMTMLALALEIENRFRIAIEPEAEREIRTVGDLVAVIRRLHAHAS